MIHPLTRSMLLIAGLVPALASATPPHDPDAPVPPLPYVTDADTTTTATLGERDWRRANEEVGEFPRGHLDILRWEAANPAPVPVLPITEGPLLSPAAAVRIALANRPELFATVDMSPHARAVADIAAVGLARDVHRAWIDAVAAGQSLRHAQAVFDATETGTELAARMTRAGNWGQDRLIVERLALSEARLQLAQARQRAFGAREALIRRLGLWGDATQFSLPDTLPDLPETPMSDAGLEATALRSHPQLSLAAIEANRTRRGAATRVQRIWEDLSAAALPDVDTSTTHIAHPLDRLISSAPLLPDLIGTPGGPEALNFARTEAHAARLAVNIRSHVREAYHQYRIAYDIARTTEDTAVPLQETLLEEAVMRYNGMLKSTWDLLASARDQVASVDAALGARRDFWLAHTNLQAVLAGADYPGPDTLGTGSSRTERAKGH